MNIPKEIADKVQAYHDAREIADKAYEEVTEWLNKNADTDNVYIGDLCVVDEPQGEEQGNGEYCSQQSYGWSEDIFSGTYFLPIEGSNKFLAYTYEY